MKALDLFCKAGGATKGLQRAGFYVVGVDIEPQPNYCGDEFHHADALTFPLEGFDFIWASPPCQGYTAMNQRWNVKRERHPRLIVPIRDRLLATGAHYAIENVTGAPLINPTVLCGHYFGLEVRRHRKIETSFPVVQPDCRPAHKPMPIAVYGDHPERHAPRRPGSGGYVNRAHDVEMARRAMGIDWMNWRELTQAIPPAYSLYIAKQFLEWRETLCACPRECDCQNPEGNPALVSNSCPVHNFNPYPYPECPVHNKATA